jgi:hypothetical protein
LDHPRYLQPKHAAFLSLVKWILLYTGLLMLCLGLARAFFGSAFFNPASIVLIIGFHQLERGMVA